MRFLEHYVWDTYDSTQVDQEEAEEGVLAACTQQTLLKEKGTIYVFTTPPYTRGNVIFWLKGYS